MAQQGIEASSSNGKGTAPLARLNGEKSAPVDGKSGLQNGERTSAGVDNLDAVDSVDAVAHATGKLSLGSDNGVNGVNGQRTETPANGTKGDSVSDSGSGGDSASDPIGTDGQLRTEQTPGFDYYGQFHPYGMVPPPPPPGPGMPHHFGPQPGHPVGPIPGPMPGHAGGPPFAYGPPGYMPPPPGVYGMDPRFGPVQGAVPGMGPMPGMMVPGGVPGGVSGGVVPGMPGGPTGGRGPPKYYSSAPEYAPRQPRPRSSAPREPRYPRQQYDGGRPQSAGSGASSPHPQSPDQLLRTALREPKNRLFVLRLERTILSLLRTPNEHSVELERMNSFHRLLAHKLADYYGIGHTSGADQSVLYYKVDGAPPAQLPPCLADLEAAGSQSPAATAGSPDSVSSGPGLVPTSPEKSEASPAAQQAPSKRVVVAKRPQLLTKQSSDGHDSPPPAGVSPAPSERASSEPCRDATSTPPDTSSAASADSSTAAPRGRGDYEARVAAYEEARARIFQQTGDDDEDDDEDNEAPDGRSFGVSPPPSDDLAEYARDPRWHANLAGTAPSSTPNAPIRMNASDSDLYHRAPTAPGSGLGPSLRFSGQSFVPRRSPKTRGPPAP